MTTRICCQVHDGDNDTTSACSHLLALTTTSPPLPSDQCVDHHHSTHTVSPSLPLPTLTLTAHTRPHHAQSITAISTLSHQPSLTCQQPPYPPVTTPITMATVSDDGHNGHGRQHGPPPPVQRHRPPPPPASSTTRMTMTATTDQQCHNTDLHSTSSMILNACILL